MPQEKFNLALCPGYFDAVKRENNIRDAAMLNCPARICGKTVQQITLRHWIILDAIDTPFQRGEIPEPIEIIRFLWVLNPRFNPRSIIRKALFVRSCQKLPYGKAAADCQTFWNETFQDQPPQIGSAKDYQSPLVSFGANVIFQTCRAINISKELALDTPLKESFQYLKLGRMRQAAERGEDHCEGNPSDALRANWIREQRKIAREFAA